MRLLPANYQLPPHPPIDQSEGSPERQSVVRLPLCYFAMRLCGEGRWMAPGATSGDRRGYTVGPNRSATAADGAAAGANSNGSLDACVQLVADGDVRGAAPGSGAADVAPRARATARYCLLTHLCSTRRSDRRNRRSLTRPSRRRPTPTPTLARSFPPSGRQAFARPTDPASR